VKHHQKRNIIRFKNLKPVKAIIQYGKNIYDKAINTRSDLKLQFLQFFPFLVASVVTGVLAFLYSRMFYYAEQLSYKIYAANKLFIFLSTPICFLLSWWIVKYFANYAKGSGIPQVMAAIELTEPNKKHLIEKFLSLRIIVVKMISSTIKVIGGGILGREGPTIHISSAVFKLIHDKLPAWWMSVSQKNVLIAGAASGLAAAFNTPLGGIIFAIEELSKFHIRYYKSPLFIAVIIAGLTAQGLGGSYLYLGHPLTNYTGSKIFLGILILSVITGYFGAVMCKLILRFVRFIAKQTSFYKQAGIVLLSGFYVALFIYLIGTEAMGSGKEIMDRSLFTNHKSVEWYLPFVRMNGLIASFGFGGAGGVFAPSLGIGTTFGALVAQWLQLNADNTNLLILVGMTGFLTAVTRAPFTSTIIIFEMTDKHSIIFLLLAGALITNLVANMVAKQSFYDVLKEIYLNEVEPAKKHSHIKNLQQ
jgi:H+/Cl- antiporter ClcA